MRLSARLSARLMLWEKVFIQNIKTQNGEFIDWSDGKRSDHKTQRND